MNQYFNPSNSQYTSLIYKSASFSLIILFTSTFTDCIFSVPNLLRLSLLSLSHWSNLALKIYISLDFAAETLTLQVVGSTTLYRQDRM